MENGDLSSPTYQGVLIQWAFFFGLVATWLIPAFLFRNMARSYNKKGWVYFLLGLSVGMVSMFVSGYLMGSIQELVSPEKALPYMIALFILPFFLMYIALRYLRNFLSKSG